MTQNEAEDILMYEDIDPPKKSRLWRFIKWSVVSFGNLMALILNAITVAFFVTLFFLFVLPLIQVLTVCDNELKLKLEIEYR